MNTSLIPILLFPWNIVFITAGIILGILLIALVVLTIVGKRMQKKTGGLPCTDGSSCPDDLAAYY
jgi:hypothetical protein